MLLQSQGHGDLLDAIDRLRSQGISRYVDLPQIVVCGDQSSGKSSVLEAVSNIQFPRNDNLCTRFATEVILRRSVEEEARVTIVPGSDRAEEDRDRLSGFQQHDVALDDLSSLVEAANAAMGLDNGTRAFSNDILRVEIAGPTQPNLTLVDLPGLFQAGNKMQSDDDAQAVASLVLSYMKKTRSIILAVVSAKNDFANQIVTRHARELDPQGRRTLGIITKPDTLHAGSDSERSFLDLAQNKDVVFQLGWHVVKNRDFDTRHTTSAERDESEQEFFRSSAWATLSPQHVGVAALKPRLSTLLRDQILHEIPQLIVDVENGLQESRATLEKMGSIRRSAQEQRLYLLNISQTFTALLQAAIDGVYSDPFFEDAATDGGYHKRLRAVVQNLLLRFAGDMRRKGHTHHIVAHATKSKRASQPRLITRAEYVDQVLLLMRRSRGCELPGTYNPQIIRDLFYEQSQPWQMLIIQSAAEIWDAVVRTLDLVLHYVADDATAGRLRRHIIKPAMAEIEENSQTMINKLMAPQREGHPITYNHYLTDNIQKFREEREKRSVIEKLDKFFGTDHSKGKTFCEKHSFDVATLANALVTETVDDMDRLACSEAIDCMRAYYKVTIKTLIDEFSVLVVERSLMLAVRSIFSPEVVFQLDDNIVSNIAAETEESSSRRCLESERSNVLETALAMFKDLQRSHRVGAQGGNDTFAGSNEIWSIDNSQQSDHDSSPHDHDHLDDVHYQNRLSASQTEEDVLLPEKDLPQDDAWYLRPTAEAMTGKKKKKKAEVGRFN